MSTKRPKGTTPEARERQLVSLAVDLAEKQLRDGSASAQVISHYIKLGSSREKLEQQRIGYENTLLQVKAENLANQAKTEELFQNAISAMARYKGQEESSEPDYDD
jgi:hypothetical protein